VLVKGTGVLDVCISVDVGREILGGGVAAGGTLVSCSDQTGPPTNPVAPPAVPRTFSGNVRTYDGQVFSGQMFFDSIRIVGNAAITNGIFTVRVADPHLVQRIRIVDASAAVALNTALRNVNDLTSVTAVSYRVPQRRDAATTDVYNRVNRDAGPTLGLKVVRRKLRCWLDRATAPSPSDDIRQTADVRLRVTETTLNEVFQGLLGYVPTITHTDSRPDPVDGGRATCWSPMAGVSRFPSSTDSRSSARCVRCRAWPLRQPRTPVSSTGWPSHAAYCFFSAGKRARRSADHRRWS